ncbi:hypothetical protein H5410_021929, partial [Solanum commersonii]
KIKSQCLYIPIKDHYGVRLWEEEEIRIKIIKEGLQYSNLENIRKLILYGVRFKPECKEGFLSDRHILIQLTNMKDYTDIILDVTSKVGTLVQPRGGNYYCLSADLFFIPIT